MSYLKLDALEQLWNSFENKIISLDDITRDHLSDIKKLMIAESVVDVSLHDIYFHAEYVHKLTDEIINLKNTQQDNNDINESYACWLAILKQRNKTPLKIKHHKKIDGECDFRFSLQLMEGMPHGFREIQILDPNNKAEVKEAINVMHRLDSLAIGLSFAQLPLVDDIVLSAILEYEDTVCLLAKDQNNQIIGYCWAMLLKNLPVAPDQKANVFWVMDLVRDPDFFDSNTKVGDQLRTKMVEVIKDKNNCDFVGYEYLVNNKFHVNITGDVQNDFEDICIHDEKFTTKIGIRYADDLSSFLRSHFIRMNENNYAYPDFKLIRRGFLQTLWHAAHSTKDYMLGGLAFFGRMQYHKITHSMHKVPAEQKLMQRESSVKQACDLAILQEIILSAIWSQQGISIFGHNHIPETMRSLQAIVKSEEFDFQSIKSCVLKSGTSLTRGELAKCFYKIISAADTPTSVLNKLLTKKEIPKDWFDLITKKRKQQMGLQNR